jgi:hypothetical protein
MPYEVGLPHAGGGIADYRTQYSNKYCSNGKIQGQTMKGSFWWRSIFILLNLYKGISHVQTGSSETILFWKDMKWQNFTSNRPTYFLLSDDENISLHLVMIQDSLQDIFNLPLIEESFEQFCEIDIPIQSIQQTNVVDKWSYIWGNDRYSPCKAYKHVIGTPSVHLAIKYA